MSFDLVAVLWGLKFGQVVKGLCIRAVKLGWIEAMNGLLVTPCFLKARLRSPRAGADAYSMAWLIREIMTSRLAGRDGDLDVDCLMLG